MSTFVVTPTNFELITNLVKDPITGQWVMPILEFNPRIINPYYGEIDLMNEDHRYQDRVVEYFYTKITEKWLNKSPEFRKLLKYFKVEKTNDKGTVSLIEDIEKAKDTTKDDLDKRYIFRYIEKHFISRKMVDRALRSYIGLTRVKWYDLFNNTDVVKDILYHRLKKIIEETIIEMEK